MKDNLALVDIKHRYGKYISKVRRMIAHCDLYFQPQILISLSMCFPYVLLLSLNLKIVPIGNRY